MVEVEKKRQKRRGRESSLSRKGQEGKSWKEYLFIVGCRVLNWKIVGDGNEQDIIVLIMIVFIDLLKLSEFYK